MREQRAHRAETMRVIDTLMKTLGVHTVGMWRSDRTATVRLENWKQTAISVDAVLPTARLAVETLLRVDSLARRSDSVSVFFSSYVPDVISLTWKTSEFAAHPERVTVGPAKR
jgi:hypothetical protein